MHVPWLLRTNFCSRYSSRSPSSVSIAIRSAVTLVTTPGRTGHDDLAGVARGALFHAGADDRRLRLEERHGLALHVRTHERAVGVVMLEERDERRGDGDDLLGRDVHVLDLARTSLRERVAEAARDAVVDEVARSSSSGAFACATWNSSSSSAGRYSISSVTIGRIGNASAFWRFSSDAPSSVNRWPALTTTLPSRVDRSAPASKDSRFGSSQPTVRLTFR